MKYVIFPVVVFLSFSLFGCQKEISRQVDFAPDPAPSVTEPLLKQYILLEGTDTVGKYEYSYDSNRRCIVNKGVEKQAGVIIYDQAYYLTYSGSDSLPSRVSYYSKDYILNDIDSVKEYFFYNTAHKIARDSIVESGNTTGLTYYYNYLPSYIDVTTNFGISQHTYQTYSGVNLINERDSISNPGSGNSVVLISASFDTHPNPFFKTNIKRPVDFNAENSAQDYGPIAQKNNPVQEDRTWILWNDHFLYTYVYRPDGYPASSVITETSAGVTRKGIYIYQ